MTGSPLKNAYEVLGVSQEATLGEITVAYRRGQVRLMNEVSQPYEYPQLRSSFRLLINPVARSRLDQEIATWRTKHQLKPPPPAANRRDNSDDPAVMYSRKVATAKGTRTRMYTDAVKEYNQARDKADKAHRTRRVDDLGLDAMLCLADVEYHAKCVEIEKIFEASVADAARLYGAPVDPIKSSGLKGTA